jgi:uncharacterized protein (DUF1697 family)
MPEPRTRLGAVARGADVFRLGWQEVYLHCPNGYGRSKLANPLIEKRLETTATTRNWNTVNKLLELATRRRLTRNR